MNQCSRIQFNFWRQTHHKLNIDPSLSQPVQTCERNTTDEHFTEEKVTLPVVDAEDTRKGCKSPPEEPAFKASTSSESPEMPRDQERPQQKAESD